MANYGGIQLPNINEQSMDDRKERRQILNYLQLLDEKLKYMFQNIDIEENLSEDSQKMFFQHGKDIRNVIKDTEGNFSLFEQTINGISLQVQDLEGNHAILQQTAEGLVSAVGSVEGNVSLLQQTATRIESEVHDLDGSVSTLKQTADGLYSTVKTMQDDVAKNASSITQTAEQIRTEMNSMGVSFEQRVYADLTDAKAELERKITKNASSITQTAEQIRSEVSQQVTSLNDDISSLDDDIYDLANDVDDVRSIAEQAADHFSWIVESGTSASRMTLTDEFLEIVADNIEIKADVDLYGEMTVYKTSSLSGVGGYFGYMYGDDPLNGSTRGIGMVDGSESGGVICHGSASAIWYDSYGITIDSSDINFVGDYDFYLATNFYCGTDGESALGKSTRTWAMLYADACSCCTSDERRKNSIGYDLTAYEGLFERLKPTQFKMNNGTSERFHIGFISQDVESAMEEIGMDSKGFAGFIKSPVYEEDEKGKEIEGGDIVDYRYGLRYEEFIALNTHMIQKLMKRVEDLENKLEALS